MDLSARQNEQPQDANTPKKQYHKPALTDHGSVAEMTQLGVASNPDGPIGMSS